MYQDILGHGNYLKTLLWQKVKSNKLFYYCEEYKGMLNFTYSRQASNLLIVIHLLLTLTVQAFEPACLWSW